MPVSCAQPRTQVRPPRVPNPLRVSSAGWHWKKGGEEGGVAEPFSLWAWMPPWTVEFSEICPSGKGYIPVEGAWMFGQTTYTGNLPTDPPSQTPLTWLGPAWSSRRPPGKLCMQSLPLRVLPTNFLSQGCRFLAGSSDLSSSWSVYTTPLWFLCSLEAEPSMEQTMMPWLTQSQGHRPEAAAGLPGPTYEARNFGELTLRKGGSGMGSHLKLEKEITEMEVVPLECLLCAKHRFKHLTRINLLILINSKRLSSGIHIF